MTNDSIKNLPANERAQAKVQEIAKIKSVAKIQRKDFQIEVQDIKVYTDRQGHFGVEVLVRAWKNGKVVGFGEDGSVEIERILIINPTTSVFDGTFRTVIDENGKEYQKPNGREDLLEGLLRDVEITLRGKKQIFIDSKIEKGKIGKTTLTVHPNAGTGTAPIDGSVARALGQNEIFSNIRSGAGNAHNDSATRGEIIIEATSTSDRYAQMWRDGYGFPTSAIGAGYIDSAVLMLYGAGAVNGLGGSIGITEFDPANGADFVNSDYERNANFTTRFASDISVASIVTNDFNDYTLNENGKAHIDPNGNTFFAAKLSFDIDNSAPSWASGQYTEVRFWSADEDQAGDLRPTLVVEYSTEPPVVYKISGTVTLNGTGVENATVRCIRQSDNTALTAVTTDANGAYEFTGLDVAEVYHVAVEYESGEVKYNAKSDWDIVPVEVE